MTTTFVGRSAQVDRLMAAVARAAHGDPSTVLLGADAGVGKTRLLAHVGALAAAQGATVVTAACVDLGEVGVPYLPFAEALAQLRATAGTVDALVRTRPALLRLVPAGPQPTSAPDDEAGRLQLFDGIAAALAATGRPGAPMVLVLEDLHWADSSSRDVLRYLVSRLRTDHVLVVASYRTDDLHRRHPLTGVVAELSRHPRVERLDVPPFTSDELREFATAVVGSAVTEETLRTVAERSEGNAYFAQELLEAGGRALPWSLGDVLRARLDRLEPAVADVARLAAVSGRTVSERLLRAAWARRDGSDVDAALREAVAEHVLVTEDSRMAFRHALLAEVVAADLLPGEVTAAHRAYRDALAADPTLGSAALLAHHARQAHDPVTALRASLDAADDAARLLAPQEELRHLETVLELWDAVPPEDRPAVDPADVMMRAASAAGRAGRDDRALALATTAVERAGEPRQAVLRTQLARYLLATDRDEDAYRTAGRALDELPAGASSLERAWACAVRARTALGVGEDAEARRRAEEAVVAARAGAHAAVEADALTTLAVLRVDDPDEAARLLRAARERAGDAGDLLTQLRCDYNLAATLFYAGRLASADRELETGLDHARRAGLTWNGFAVQLQLLQHLVRFTTGDLTAPEPPEAGAPPAAAASLAAVRLYSAVARGDEDAVGAARALEPAGRTDGQVALVAGGCHVDALVWLGRSEEAADRAEAVIEQMCHAWNDYFLGGIWLAALAIGALADGATDDRLHGRDTTAAVRRGDALLHRAVTTAQRGRPRGGQLGPEGRAWLARAHAEHARLRGRAQGGPQGRPHGDEDADDVALWSAATDAFGYGHRYEEARSRYRLAEALLGAGDRERAHEQAEQALAAARAMGARPLAAAVEALGRRGRLDLPSARTGGEVLTAREEEVLRLVAEGLSNRQIGERLYISGKTVSVHVSNLLAKLGASGRAEAVTVAHRRGLLTVERAVR